jgi:hypothetical protein
MSADGLASKRPRNEDGAQIDESTYLQQLLAEQVDLNGLGVQDIHWRSYRDQFPLTFSCSNAGEAEPFLRTAPQSSASD